MPPESPGEVFLGPSSSARPGPVDFREVVDRDGACPGPPSAPEGPGDGRAWIWGVPFSAMTRATAAEAVMDLVEAGRPSICITANTHYTMLCHEGPELRGLNARAALILADGAPLVWASRRGSTPLPERVAGSDLIFDLCRLAAGRGYRPFLLGGGDGVAEAAAGRLVERYPGLEIAGTASPSPADLADPGCDDLIERIRDARPDLLFAALGQPKGELWLDRHLERLGVPVCLQVGASLDFIAGRVRRAPPWVQSLGMEWAYRMWLEPRRLGPRYARNARFLLAMIAGDLAGRARGAEAGGPAFSPSADRRSTARDGRKAR